MSDNHLVGDTETRPDDLPADLIEEPDAPSNYKDEAKIKAYIDDAKRKEVETRALRPWKCRVVCIGLQDRDGTLVWTAGEMAEEEMLARFWAAWTSHHPFVGFCCNHFDLPVLLARSWLLGVSAPPVQVRGYRADAIDLADKLAFDGQDKLEKLSWYARRFGLPVEDGVCGKDIPALAAAGDWEAIRQHCASDVALTAALARRLGVIHE